MTILRYGNTEFSLQVSKRPITMQYLYRICRGAYNEDLFSFVRTHQALYKPLMYSLPEYNTGEFQLLALDPLQDLRVYLPDQSILFSDFLVPILGYKPELWTADKVFELFLQQTA